MAIKMGYCEEPNKKKVNYIAAYLCFMTFGFLVAINKTTIGIVSIGVSVFVALLFAIVAIKLMIWSFTKANPDLCAQTGGTVAQEAVSQGMSFMIPFTILAVLANVLLGWNAVMPFASAAIMTAGASAGMEVTKAGGKGIKNILLPTVLSFIVSTLWMLVVGLLP